MDINQDQVDLFQFRIISKIISGTTQLTHPIVGATSEKTAQCLNGRDVNQKTETDKSKGDNVASYHPFPMLLDSAEADGTEGHTRR